MAVFRIKIQGTSGSGFGIWIQGLLLYYNQYFMLKKKLGSGSGFRSLLEPDSDFWQETESDSMNMDPKHCHTVHLMRKKPNLPNQPK